MKKTILKVVALAMCLCMVAGMFAACADKKEEEIVIGVTGPLTGGASIYGIAVKNSAQLAVEEINAMEDNGLNGLKLKLDMRDDKHDPENVASLYTGLYEAGMQVSLGTVTTKPGLEFKNLSKEDNVFFLTPSATGDAIPEFANGYQMCFADSNQGTVAAQYFNENYKGKTVGIFYQSDDEYSTGIRQNFLANLNEDFKVEEASFLGEASTFDSQINLLKDCDVVFMPIYYTPASQFMTQANGVQNKIGVYYGCDGFDGIDAIKGFNINDVPQEVSMLSHFNSTATEGPAADFIKKYNEKYDEEKEPLNQFGAAAYDCVYAIYEALKVAIANGEEVTAETSASDMCEILKKVFNSDTFEFRGITGKCEGNEKSHISWSEDGTVVKEAIKYIVKDSNNK